METVKEAMRLTITGSTEEIRREYLRLRERMERASLSQCIAISRVADRLWKELRKRGVDL